MAKKNTKAEAQQVAAQAAESNAAAAEQQQQANAAAEEAQSAEQQAAEEAAAVAKAQAEAEAQQIAEARAALIKAIAERSGKGEEAAAALLGRVADNAAMVMLAAEAQSVGRMLINSAAALLGVDWSGSALIEGAIRHAIKEAAAAREEAAGSAKAAIKAAKKEQAAALKAAKAEEEAKIKADKDTAKAAAERTQIRHNSYNSVIRSIFEQAAEEAAAGRPKYSQQVAALAGVEAFVDNAATRKAYGQNVRRYFAFVNEEGAALARSLVCKDSSGSLYTFAEREAWSVAALFSQPYSRYCDMSSRNRKAKPQQIAAEGVIYNAAHVAQEGAALAAAKARIKAYKEQQAAAAQAAAEARAEYYEKAAK